MTSRLYTVADYVALKPWWQGRWGAAPAIHALPQSGIIVSDEGGDLAAGWLYLDMTTPTALLAFVVSNPERSPRDTVRGLKTMIGGLIELALSQGRVNMLAACPSGSLSRLFEGCGFTSRDSGIEHLTLDLSKWQPE